MTRAEDDESGGDTAVDLAACLALWSPLGPDRIDAALIAWLKLLNLAPDNIACADGRIVRFSGSDIRLDLANACDWLSSSDHCPDLVRATGLAPPDPGTGTMILLSATADPVGRMPIAQKMCAIAALMVKATDAQRLYWSPAGLWSSTAHLERAVTASEDIGIPPVLHLIGFDHGTRAGGRRTTTTHGLAWFAGHEMTLTWASPLSESDALRRVSRLAIDAMLHCGLVGPMTVAGMEQDEIIEIGGLTTTRQRPMVYAVVRSAPA